jgi:hypothetical protein
MEGIREAKHESQAGLTGKPKYYIYPFSPASWQFKPRDLFVCLRLMLICLVLELVNPSYCACVVLKLLVRICFSVIRFLPRSGYSISSTCLRGRPLSRRLLLCSWCGSYKTTLYFHHVAVMERW